MFRSKHLQRGMGLTAAAAVMAATLAWSATPAHANETVPAPINLTTNPTPLTANGAVQLSWQAPAGGTISHYQIFRHTGSTTPEASPVTYVNRTAGTELTFTDSIATEGFFWYSVMAVDAQGRASAPSNWAWVVANFPGNGETIAPDTQVPAQPSALRLVTGVGSVAGPIYTKSERVTLTWPKGADSDLWRYLVYRQKGTAAAQLIRYEDPQAASATLTLADDDLDGDGTYTYWVVAQDKAGNLSPESAKVVAHFDTVAPAVQITAPVNGQSYSAGTALTISAATTDASGYEPSAVKYYLNETLLASPVLNSLTTGLHTVKVEVTDRAGNTGSASSIFVVNSQTNAPGAPRSLSAPAHTNLRSVVLAWQAPEAGTVTQYRIYRSSGGQNPVAVGTAGNGQTSFVDALAADGVYSYFVVAENGSAVSSASNVAVVKVDTVAPVIAVTAPQEKKVYRNSGTLTPVYTISDATSGYETAQVKLYLDNTRLTGTTIDLASLSAGGHTFRVDVADRAGNIAQKSVSFTVGTSEGEQPSEPQSVLELLASLKSQIHHGQYTAISAQIRSGNIDAAIKHIQKHRGKFITPEAADKLLQALTN